MSEDFYKKLERDALKRILQLRADRKNGIRKFSSKQDEHETMIKEAMENVECILENNNYYYEKEIRCTYFKFTEKDVKEIEEFFHIANENLDYVKHSPIWDKHQSWMQYAIENNDR